MIINPNDNAAISHLRIDDIAFPDIDYSGEPNIDRRGRSRLHSAYSIIINKVNLEYLAGFEWNPTGDQDWLNNKRIELEGLIRNGIDDERNQPSDFGLTRLFILIQLWGGSAGRGVFVRGRGWPDNFNLEAYRTGVRYALEHNPMEALNSIENINYLGTAFSTKHLSFWSSKEYPVYDSILSKIVFGRRGAKRRQYPLFLEAINGMITDNNLLTAHSIERNLFNWANSDEGQRWSEMRMV